MKLELSGIHHLTAITAQAPANLRFYTEALGLRLVKKTVNQDDTSAYHLFYGDGAATPGSDVTFFDWPVSPERRGTNSIVRTGLRVSGNDALDWWRARLSGFGIAAGESVDWNGRPGLPFEDPEGQRLLLVDDGGEGEAHPWQRSPVPPSRQIRGLGPITISVPRLDATAHVLTDVLHMRKGREHPDPDVPGAIVHVFAMGAGGPAAELHVAVTPGLTAAVQGAGGVHHVAFRTPDRESLHAWAEWLSAQGLRSSGEVERYYFRSLYFREPNGILFEIATDGPGFAVDEPLETLGEKLSLPPFLEGRRNRIEAGLRPLA
ncbi:MAG: ring-cleaving dioxygenase [Acetobacteraceae bacterium]|nr:ring-cleaving dioxygenase [Acetobacteraceae bacterium]